jgi:hypothetical protein
MQFEIERTKGSGIGSECLPKECGTPIQQTEQKKNVLRNGPSWCSGIGMAGKRTGWRLYT